MALLSLFCKFFKKWLFENFAVGSLHFFIIFYFFCGFFLVFFRHALKNDFHACRYSSCLWFHTFFCFCLLCKFRLRKCLFFMIFCFEFWWKMRKLYFFEFPWTCIAIAYDFAPFLKKAGLFRFAVGIDHFFRALDTAWLASGRFPSDSVPFSKKLVKKWHHNYKKKLE